MRVSQWVSVSFGLLLLGCRADLSVLFSIQVADALSPLFRLVAALGSPLVTVTASVAAAPLLIQLLLILIATLFAMLLLLKAVSGLLLANLVRVFHLLH